MILDLKRAATEIEHNEKTVKNFIDNVIYKTKDKENKVFVIHTLQDLEDCQNMILYFQGGVLKSHHTSLMKFNYNDVLNYEIINSYKVRYILLEDVISVDADNEEEMKSHLSRNKDNTYIIPYIDYEEDSYIEFEKILNKMSDEEKLKNFIHEKKSHKIGVVIDILIDKVLNNEREISFLKNREDDYVRDIYVLQQKLKWLNEKNI
ncbi:hypothetical protein ACFO6R_06485 [Eubacterium multiforme]|uniref:Uncharacterized protein n=1 Tax=Eubacterium multiforme TaxID=83339 RepID=A0ABT9USF6_9FIRM|nr:hypothetical protein [Eubacterium multiforme]MDQ0149241.1 hypothetical protein [Eubacterium multiforme]